MVADDRHSTSSKGGRADPAAGAAAAASPSAADPSAVSGLRGRELRWSRRRRRRKRCERVRWAVVHQGTAAGHQRDAEHAEPSDAGVDGGVRRRHQPRAEWLTALVAAAVTRTERQSQLGKAVTSNRET